MGLKTISVNGVSLSFPDDLVMVWDETGIWLSYAPASQTEREAADDALAAPLPSTVAPVRPALPADVTWAAIQAALEGAAAPAPVPDPPWPGLKKKRRPGPRPKPKLPPWPVYREVKPDGQTGETGATDGPDVTEEPSLE